MSDVETVRFERSLEQLPFPASYAYLGPEGTFTEAALLRVPGAAEALRLPTQSAASALAMVREGEVYAAMLPIENSVEGGVSATLDALGAGDELRIIREVVVPVSFVLAVSPGSALVLGQQGEDARIVRVGTHPHAWAQTRGWAQANIPGVEYVPTTSTAAAAHELLKPAPAFEAAISSKFIADRLGLTILAENIEDNPGAVTRFILIARPAVLPPVSGADKTTLTVPLENRPGALMEILDQFASRGVNLSRIESRPTGQLLGQYSFSIDVDGHIAEARVADALQAVHRASPQLRFLGSYSRADAQPSQIPEHTTDMAFAAARTWLSGILRELPCVPPATGEDRDNPEYRQRSGGYDMTAKDSNDDGTIVNPKLNYTPADVETDEPEDVVDQANDIRFLEENKLIREQGSESG